MRSLLLLSFFTFGLLLLLLVVFTSIVVVVSGHEEEWFPENWQDEEYHRERISRHFGAVNAVRTLLQLPHHRPLSSSTRFTADPADCKICFGIANTLIDLVTSKTGDAIIDDVLDGYCEKHFTNNTKDATICTDVVNTLVKLVGGGLHELVDNLHFNVSSILCADLLNLCVEPCCDTAKPYQPEQRRLSFANSRGSGHLVNMTVSWLTLAATPQDYIEYTINGGKEVYQTSNACRTTDTKQYNYGGFVGVIHGCEFWNLPHNSTIQYRVGSSLGVSSWTSFKTLPSDIGTATGRPLRLAVVADIGIYNSSYTIQRIIERVGELDGFVLVGDQGYFDGNEADWNTWQRETEPIVSRVPLITGPGNHELLSNFSSYQFRYSQFNPPAGNGAPADAMYYFLNIGPLNFFMLNSETPINTANIDAVQRQWMSSMMPPANAIPGTFLWANHHRPLYCSNGGSDCGFFAELLRSQVEDIYKANNVDLLQCGHMHSYERTYPVYKNQPTQNNSYFFPDGMIEVLNGLPGNREPISRFSEKSAWSAFQYNADFVYQVVELQQSVIGDGRLHTTFSSKTYRSLTNEIVDQFAITSKR